eukprot:735768-Rhodomonas_salina.1
MGRKLSRQVLGAGETVVQSVVWTQAASLPTAEGIATQVRGRAQSEIQGCILPAFMCSCTMLDSQQRRAGGEIKAVARQHRLRACVASEHHTDTDHLELCGTCHGIRQSGSLTRRPASERNTAEGGLCRTLSETPAHALTPPHSHQTARKTLAL